MALPTAKEYGLKGDGSNEGAKLQGYMDATGEWGRFERGTYGSDLPILLGDGARVEGQSWKGGARFKVLGGTDSGWKRKGFFMSRSMVSKGQPNDSVHIERVFIDGGGAKYGSAVSGYFVTSTFDYIWVDNFNSQDADDGCAVALRTKYNSGDIVQGTGVNNRIRNIRSGAAGSVIRIEGDKLPNANPTYTDWIIKDIIALKRDNAHGPRIEIWNSGGGVLDMLHTNAGGREAEGVYLHNAYQAIIQNLYLDGWGIGGTAKAGVRIDQLVAGGVVIINNIRCDYRATGGKVPVEVHGSGDLIVDNICREDSTAWEDMILPSQAKVGIVT